MSELARVGARSDTSIPLRIALWCLAAAVLYGLLLDCVLTRYAHPNGDDFRRAWLLREHGIVGATLLEYVTWHGRWVAALVQFGIWSVFDVVHQYAAPLLLLRGVILASYCVFVRRILLPHGGKRLVVLTAGALWLLMWTSFRSQGQSAYQVVMLVENQMAIALGLVVLASVVTDAASRLETAAHSCLAAVVAGLHELHGLLLLMVLGAIGAWRFRARGSLSRHSLIVMAATLGGLAVVVVSPGNSVRAEMYPEPSLAAALPLALVQTAHAPYRWLANPRALAALATLLFLSSIGGGMRRRIGGALAILGLGAGLTSIGLFLPVYIRTQHPAYRTQDACGTVLLVAALIAAAVLGDLDRYRPAPSHSGAPTSVLILAVALLLSTNTREATIDLRSRSPEYDREMQRRYVRLEAAARQGRSSPVRLPVPEVWPHTQSRSSERFAIGWYPRYFGVNGVRLDGETTTP